MKDCQICKQLLNDEKLMPYFHLSLEGVVFMFHESCLMRELALMILKR